MKYMNPPWLPYKVSGRSGVLFVSFPIFSSSFPQNFSFIEMHFPVLVNSYHADSIFALVGCAFLFSPQDVPVVHVNLHA